MPDAIAGVELPSRGYAFTTLASLERIELFYIVEMPANGWDYLTTGKSAKGGLFIVFSDGASVSVSPLSDGEGTKLVVIITN